MKKITCNVSDPYFSFILEGTKTIEGRVRKGKWDNLSVGDHLLISKDLQGTQVEFEIISLYPCENFEQLYSMFGGNLLPDLPQNPWNVYSKWFSKEDVLIYGVIGIELQRITYF